MKKPANLLISLLSLSLLVSCSGNNGSTNNDNDEEFQFDDIPLVDKPIEFEDKSDYYCNHAYDVDSNYRILIGSQLEVEPSLLNSNNHSYVSITDSEGINVDYITQISTENGNDYFMLSPVYGTSFEPGRYYEVKLNDDSLFFKDKDPEMDTFYFNVKQEEEDRRIISDQVKYLDVNDVIGEPNFDDRFAPTNPGSIEAAEYFRTHIYDFLYKKDVSNILKTDDLFYVAEKSGNQWHIGFTSFPGKFVKCTYDSDYRAYHIYMKHADLNEIYDDGDESTSDLNVYQEYVPAAFTGLKNEFNEKEIINELKKDEKFLSQVDAVREALGTDVGVSTMDIVSHLSFDFSFRVDAPKVDFQVKVGVLFPLDDYTQIKIEFIYQYSISFRCSAGIKVKRMLGVPYWIEANGDVDRITDEKYTANIIFMNKWKTEEKKDTNLHEIILKSLWKLEENPSYFTPGGASKCRGNTRTMPLLSFNIPFSIFNFHIGLDFALTIDFNVMFGYTYVSHSEERVVTFTTNDGVKCTANEVSNSSSCHQFSFLGEINIKTGLSLTIDLEVCGLRGVFSVGVKADIGAYMDVKGGLIISWGDDIDTTSIFTASFEAGIYAGVTGFLDVLIFHPKYEFLTKKWPFIIAGKAESIAEMACPTNYEITTTNPINLDNTNITLAKVFSGTSLNFGLKHFNLNQTVELNTGILEPSHKIKPITLESNSEYLVVDAKNNTIQVVGEELPPNFEATLTLRINKEMALSSGTKLEYKINVIYKAESAINVSFVGNNIVHNFLIYEGTEVRLPILYNDTSLEANEMILEKYKYRDNMKLDLGILRHNSVNRITGFVDDKGNVLGSEGEYIIINKDTVIKPMYSK